MANNIFNGAKFGDRFTTRDGKVAYYGRYDEKEDKHFLMVNDFENDYILCHNDGHVFHFDKEDYVFPHGKNKGKTIFEANGWDKEEMVNFRLDIVSRWVEPIDEAKLDDMANNQNRVRLLSTQQLREIWKSGFKAGYRAAKQE